MATENSLQTVSLLVDTDLSSYIYRFVKLTAAKTVGLCTAASNALVGILQDKPKASGQAGEIAIGGVSKLVLGDTVVYGAKLTSDSTGRGVTATATQRFGAIALEGGAVNEVISVKIEFGEEV